MLVRKQGDSIWIDIEGINLDQVDPVWDNWSGSWAIIPSLEDPTPLAQGALGKKASLGLFTVRIGKSVMNNLAKGTYALVVQVDNVNLDYQQEIAQEKLVVKPQGITA